MGKKLIVALALVLALTSAAALPTYTAYLPTVCAASTNSGDFQIEKGVLVNYTGEAKEVVIPSSVTAIGERAFSYCTTVEKVTIPNTVKTIGDGAFAYCYELESVTIPGSVTSIGAEAFTYTELKQVTLPDSVKTVGSNAFEGCRMMTQGGGRRLLLLWSVKMKTRRNRTCGCGCGIP